MVHYKLYYFNFRGRGELIRLIFEAAGQKYEDHRFEFNHWHQWKSLAPFGRAPWLEIHEGGHTTVLTQSPTIARYLARRFHLAGKNEIEAAELEMYGDQLFDLQTEIINTYLESDEHVKKHLHDKLIKSTFPHNLDIFEARLAKTGSHHFAESGFSWVDLFLVNILDSLGEDKIDILADYKHIRELDEKVREMPNIAEWLEKRPKTHY